MYINNREKRQRRRQIPPRHSLGNASFSVRKDRRRHRHQEDGGHDGGRHDPEAQRALHIEGPIEEAHEYGGQFQLERTLHQSAGQHALAAIVAPD